MSGRAKQGESGAKPSAHTPGPWIIVKHGTDADIETRQDSGMVCCVATVWTRGERQAANSRLIASAPELLEALEAVDRLYSTPVPNPMWPEVSPYGLIPNSGEVGKMIGAVRDAIRKARG